MGEWLHMFSLLMVIIMVTSVTSRGLNFTLDKKSEMWIGDFLACGTLLCEQKIPASDTVNSGSEDYQYGADLVPGGILSMAIFRKPAKPSSAKTDEYGRELLLDSLTLERSNIHLVTDRMSFEGLLEDTNAWVKLGLFKDDDCRSDFICEVTGSEEGGREFLNTATLLRQSEWEENQNGSGDAALQSEFATKIEQVTSLMEVMEEALRSNPLFIEQQGKDQPGPVGEHNHGQPKSLELISFERRLGDKLHDLENRIEDKIYQLNEKLSTLKDDHAQRNAEKIVLEKLDTLGRKLDTKSQQDDNKTLDRISVLISSREEKCIRNLSVNSEILSQRMADVMNSSQEELHRISELLEFISLNKSTESQTMCGSNQLTQNTSTLPEQFKQTMVDFFMPKSCKKGMRVFLSGPYPHPLIYPSGEPGYETPYLCDTTSDGGGWIIIQRRATGNVDFYRDWNTYKKGFGSLDDEFWLGNERLHTLTRNGTWELRVDLKFEGKEFFAHYATFYVTDEKSKYTLHIGPYDGNAGDSLLYHNAKKFSTFDNDNDSEYNFSCAKKNSGGWWYHKCDLVDLNSEWNGGLDKGIEWTSITKGASASFSEMKIRLVK